MIPILRWPRAWRLYTGGALSWMWNRYATSLPQLRCTVRGCFVYGVGGRDWSSASFFTWGAVLQWRRLFLSYVTVIFLCWNVSLPYISLTCVGETRSGYQPKDRGWYDPIPAGSLRHCRDQVRKSDRRRWQGCRDRWVKIWSPEI